VERLFLDLEEILKRRETVLIFTQYTDTMDYLRERLLPVYGSQVACYSGRGGERWDGSLWKEVTKEEIKIAFKKGEKVKILLCTEAASEGLNLQTCGVLINYDMPWNPMRVEQRIGRIDRIGQVHPEVWIKNYFYEDTVEATVYQRLEDRIDWFQEVVGELQPILSRIGEVIQKVALSSKEARKKLLEMEINKIREELKARQVDALNLDELAATARLSPGFLSTPINLGELEGLFINATPFNHRLKVHGKIPKTYEMDREEEKIQVTFDPATFDQHPQTVRLCSFGEDLFDKLLKEVPKPEESSEKIGIVRCRIDDPFPCVAFYGLDHGELMALETFEDFKTRLEGQYWPTWSSDDLEAVKSKFLEHIEGIEQKFFEAKFWALQAEKRALEEQAKNILVGAALIDLALQLKEELFFEDFSADSLEQAIRGLRKHKFPFAPLLLNIEMSLSGKPFDYRFFQKIQGEPQKSLEKRFETIKEQATEILGKLSKQRSILPRHIARDQIEIKILKLPFGELAE
jgi:hypothetical protein